MRKRSPQPIGVVKPKWVGTIPVPAEAVGNSKSAVVHSPLKLPLFTSLLLAVSFPRLNFYWLAWIALVPLLRQLERTEDLKRAFGISYFSGFFFILLSIHWLKEVSLFGFLFLCFYQAIYFGMFGLLAQAMLKSWMPLDKKAFSPRAIVMILVILPALWVVFEWARAEIPVMGFGWNLLAYSQADNLRSIQLAKLLGAYGVSFLVAWVNVAVYMLLGLGSRRGKLFTAVLGFLPLLWNFCYGAVEIREAKTGAQILVGVIQGNVEQEEKWDPKLKNLIIEKYMKLTELASFDGPDLVVWPEAAYPDFFNVDRATSPVPGLIKRLGFPLLVGSPHQSDELHYYNSAYLLSSEGKIVDRYDKLHLVPFGEYIPFKPILSFLEPYAYSLGVGDFSSGSRYTVFQMPLGKDRGAIHFSVLICFEDIFPNLAKRFVQEGAQCLFVLTNDAWFGKTGAPFQHLQASVFRAIENAIPVVRAGNIGVSAFISSTGKVQDRVRNEKGFETYVTGALTRPVTFFRGETFYQQWGYLFPWFCLFAVSLSFILPLQRRLFVAKISPSKLKN